jgi:predicted nucleic acid-binding protein
VTAVLVDSNVILDVFTEDPEWFGWSSDALARAADESILVINQVVYAEVSVRFSRVEDCDEALPVGRFRRDTLPWEAAFLAGKVFTLYRRRGGNRTLPLPDFFIGAHAAVTGMALVTRDTTRYRSYFPKLSLIAP